MHGSLIFLYADKVLEKNPLKFMKLFLTPTILYFAGVEPRRIVQAF